MDKMELSPGNIVKSLKGHDTGRLYLIVGAANADFVLIADGKSRTVEKPKLKRAKHLKFVSEGAANELRDKTANNLQDSDVVCILRKQGTAMS